MRDDLPSHDHATILPDMSGSGSPNAQSPTQAVMVPLNAISPLNANLPGIVANSSVDVINNLTQGALLSILPGVPPGPQSRVYELSALPDVGAGNIALPEIVGVPGKGTITAVDNNGNPVGSGGTGFAFTLGAFASSLNPISTAIYASSGWAFSFTYRVPTGARNSGKTWVAIGQRLNMANYGVSVTETATGGLSALIEDARQVAVKVVSANVGRDQQHKARLAWNAATQQVQWMIDGVASGAAASLTWVPQFGGGTIQLCSNYTSAVGATPTGALYQFVFETTPADQNNSYIPVGPSATLSAADAQALVIDTTGIFFAISAGDVSFSYQTASGPASQDVTVAFGGFVAPAQTLTSYVGADMPYCPIDVGNADPNGNVLVLTPPVRGKLQTGFSTQFYGPGALAPVSVDGLPPRNYLEYIPNAGGIQPGQNVNGSMLRGGTDLTRTQQNTTVRVTNLIEMNRAPKLNGGGEAWGHANDSWVPIASLFYQYDPTTYLFPTIDKETPVVTVTGLPGPGEGTIRMLRTGVDLKIGDTVPFALVRQLGWNKPGVANVSASCALTLQVSAPTAPISTETYALKITDAGRPAGLTWWEQANVLYSDQQARIRWASRGGDWAGVDGAWGAVPFAASALIQKVGTVTIDVTQMVQSGGTEFFIAAASPTATITVTPGFFPSNPAIEPMLRVTGGTRAGSYSVTRCAPITDSDTTGWKTANTTAQSIRHGQPLLIAFDGAGAPADLATASKIELLLNVTGVNAGGGVLQLFRPAAQPPRPGAHVSVSATPILQRADLITKVDSDADWNAMLGSVDLRNRAGVGQPTNYTIANGCYYGGIAIGANGGLSLLKGFWKSDGTGYPVVRMARMVGWHQNYQPADASIASGLIVSGKSPGMIASGSGSLANLTSGFGGRIVDGFGGYSCRSERGVTSGAAHASTSPMAKFLAFGDYDYFLNGNTNGVTTFGINPVPRMQWLWIETVYKANTINADGTWANDGVFELYVNGRKQCESRRIEWRVGGNPALWDAIWFDEYNGGTAGAQPDRLWPFVVGPTYVVASADPIAPPAGWNVPFVTAAGAPDSVALAYSPELS